MEFQIQQNLTNKLILLIMYEEKIEDFDWSEQDM